MSLAELDDAEVVEVSLGLPAGPSGRFQVLQRLRGTLREAVRRAGTVASMLAGASRESVLDPQRRPSAVRIARSEAARRLSTGDEVERQCLLLDYDVGLVEDGRPRTSRPMRLMMLVQRSARVQGQVAAAVPSSRS